MWEEVARSWETSSHDGVGEGDGGLQLDQGNVVTAEEARTFRFITVP